MKKQFLLPAVLLVGFATTLTSCKKDNDDAVTPSKQECMIDHATTYTAAGTRVDSAKLTYDSDSRIIKEQTFNNAGQSTDYTLYTYSSSEIVAKDYDQNGDQTTETKYQLNSNNNAIREVVIEDGNQNTADTTWYSYNSNKQVTRSVTKHTTVVIVPVASYDTTWYTYSGGNLTKEETKTSNGDVSTTIYAYGSDDAKTEFFTPGPNLTSVRNLFGDTSDKLPTSMTADGVTTTYNYTFNGEGYVTRLEPRVSGTSQGRIDFSYNCK
jgi:hypothetical protein